MKYCQNCGKQIDDNAKFCEYCGSAQTPMQQQSSAAPQPVSGKRLHCPKCKDSRLAPIVETDVNGGFAVSRSFGRKWGASAIDLKSTHRNYWMCRSCGHKFRNIDSLDEEIATMAKAQKSGFILMVLFLVLGLLTLMLGGGFPAAVILAEIMFVCIWVFFKNKIAKMQQERAVLEQECFN